MVDRSDDPRRRRARDDHPIGDVEWRSLVRVRGRVRSERVLPWEGTRTLELVVVDGTGGITAVFTGRRSIPGLDLGCEVELVGRAGSRRGYLALLNPEYTICARR